ncbi:MAG: Histidine triad (HIT) protein [Parcubacteria group bacterium GW2011_GWA2_36_10]|nr:MAG: Histidine triad (HIT) protein [Parcubacteria group bacterium GW2011_GWA2_36_10]
MENCIFCQIVKGDIPAKKIYEDDYYLAFLSLGPASPGHTIVIPKKHTATFIELEPQESADLIKVVQRLAKEIKERLKADAFNLGLNNGEIAGQVIPHVHWHIIPRYKNDTLVHWGVDEQAKDQMDEVLAKLVSL